jgi:hypothetical protein
MIGALRHLLVLALRNRGARVTGIAWDDVEPGIWWDPEFLKNYEGKGEQVTLKPAGHESVALRLIVVEDQ